MVSSSKNLARELLDVVSLQNPSNHETFSTLGQVGFHIVLSFILSLGHSSFIWARKK